MKKILLLILISINSIISICYSQNDIKERQPFVLKLAVDNDQFYRMNVEKSNYFVKENILQIYPTEKLNIEVQFVNDYISSMKVVKKIINPKTTIQIEFRQNIKDKKSEGMMLIVKNPFNKKLIYNAQMFIVGQNKWIPTSIMPIFPNIVGYETWSDVIITLALDKWRFEK
jgi:hypothetical protein